MLDAGSRQAIDRRELETELMEILRQRQHDWAAATDGDRDLARQRFMNALHEFNSLVLYGKPPQA